jgi:hypothetical protein
VQPARRSGRADRRDHQQESELHPRRRHPSRPAGSREFELNIACRVGGVSYAAPLVRFRMPDNEPSASPGECQPNGAASSLRSGSYQHGFPAMNAWRGPAGGAALIACRSSAPRSDRGRRSGRVPQSQFGRQAPLKSARPSVLLICAKNLGKRRRHPYEGFHRHRQAPLLLFYGQRPDRGIRSVIAAPPARASLPQRYLGRCHRPS